MYDLTFFRENEWKDIIDDDIAMSQSFRSISRKFLSRETADPARIDFTEKIATTIENRLTDFQKERLCEEFNTDHCNWISRKKTSLTKVL